MYWKWFKRKVVDTVALFNGHFIEVKAFYVQEFSAVPCVTFIGELDASGAYAYIKEQLKGSILTVYQHSYFEHSDQQLFFNNTILVLRDKRMIEIGSNYCQVLYSTTQYAWAGELVKALAAFRVVNKEPAIGFARQTSMN